MSGTLVEAQQLDSDDWLVVTLHYRGYKFPHFDIRHKGFEVEFFGECQESVKLPQELIDAYQAARDTAPIFIQARDDVRFGAADMVRFYLQKRGAKLEEFIPEQERRAEGSTFEVIFTIEFAEGAFYMDTQSGRRSIRKLMLRVEISWLPHDESRPTIATLPHLPGPV